MIIGIKKNNESSTRIWSLENKLHVLLVDIRELRVLFAKSVSKTSAGTRSRSLSRTRVSLGQATMRTLYQALYQAVWAIIWNNAPRF